MYLFYARADVTSCLFVFSSRSPQILLQMQPLVIVWDPDYGSGVIFTVNSNKQGTKPGIINTIKIEQPLCLIINT